jgi:hypothetical protein
MYELVTGKKAHTGQNQTLKVKKYICSCPSNDGILGEVSGQLQTLNALPKGQSPQSPLKRRMHAPMIHSGQFGEEKNILLKK